MEEQVLAFPRRIVDDLGCFHGLEPDHSRYLDAIFRSEDLKFVPRGKAENDFTLKQLIPYVVILSGDKVLFYVRGKGAGDARLRLKGSVGIGGHINPVDEDLFHGREDVLKRVYEAAVSREVREEVEIGAVRSKRILGVINDDTNDVGKVHFGVAHLWELEKPEAAKAEKAITRLEFLGAGEILDDKGIELESWSRFCLENLKGG
jgi:predicted NUDIX family phosphoesterase